MKKISRLLLLLLPILGWLGSCNHIDLVDEVASNRVPVRVIFDWSNDPCANPEGMTLYISYGVDASDNTFYL